MSLTRERIERKFDEIENSPNYSGVLWMGIEFSWERLAKRDGGNVLRKKVWGVWRYRDVLADKELIREDAILEIMKPFDERKNKVDMTNIKYCASCGNIAVGEKEQLLWGQLKYSSKYRQYSDGSRYAIYEYAEICPVCCRIILKGGTGTLVKE